METRIQPWHPSFLPGRSPDEQQHGQQKENPMLLGMRSALLSPSALGIIVQFARSQRGLLFIYLILIFIYLFIEAFSSHSEGGGESVNPKECFSLWPMTCAHIRSCSGGLISWGTLASLILGNGLSVPYVRFLKSIWAGRQECYLHQWSSNRYQYHCPACPLTAVSLCLDMTLLYDKHQKTVIPEGLTDSCISFM